MGLACLQDTEASISHSANTSVRLFIVKLKDSLKQSFSQEWMMEASNLHRSGMTLQHLTEISLRDWLTLFTEDSPVRTLALQERAQDWKESEAVYLGKSLEYAKKHPLLLFSLKTYQQLEPEDQLKCKKHWPASGMIRDGLLYPLPKSERIIDERDGFVLPTPTTIDSGSRFNKSASSNAKNRPTLGAMAKFNLWPTPTVCGNYQNKNGMKGLATKVKESYPTPCARDWKDNASPSEFNRNSPTLATKAGGQLNPTWVEWLMGLPLGWTELKPWAMEWFRCKSKQRLKN